jgi:transcription elongation factor GreA
MDAMPIRDLLPPILRGEDLTDLAPESRTRLASLAGDAAHEQLLVWVRDECAARLRQPGATPSVEYLLAHACARNGEIERAHQTLLALGDKLATARQWEPLAAVAEEALSLEESAAAARLLVRAHEGLGRDPARIDALSRAWGLLQDDLELGLLLAVRLGDAGQGDHRRALLAELLPRFAAEGRHAGLEEAALEFVEHEDVDCLISVVRVLPLVAASGALRETMQLLEIAFPGIARAGRAGEVLSPLRVVLGHAVEAEGPMAGEPLRGPLLEALRQGPGRALPDVEPVIQISGVGDRVKPLMPAIERFDAIAALPPKQAVLHDAFGAGRILSNDGDTVLIDFSRSAGHKMPYAAARRTLTPIAEDDLRLLAATRPAELAKMRADAPAEIVLRALHALGGGADAQRLKMFLVGSALVPAPEWTTFWRRAKAAADKDPRIDTSRSFEQHFRVAPAGEAGEVVDAPLPALEPRKSLKSNIATLRKFLSQHPGAEAPLARRFGKYIEKGLLDPELERGDRARAGIIFARWFPERADLWIEVLKSLWDQGLAISDLPGEDEQIAMLEVSHSAGVEADAILSGLDSRFSAVRDQAIALRERLDPAGRAELERTLLRHASRYPGAALRRIEHVFELRESSEEMWRAFIAALTLIEEKPKPSVAEKVLRWLGEGGLFETALAGHPCPEEMRLGLRILLRQWKSSDRYLFPALEAAERLGFGDETQAVHAARQKSAEKLFDRVGQVAEEAEIPVMTRATWERLKNELERMERELRTTIPAAIQKARELGDLKENAEYHSAKLKQANVGRLVASLQLRLSRARFVDEMEHKDGVVGLGTEVVLESEEDVVTYWVLGEGEHHHGDHVISHQAPVARQLVGRAIGDEVDLGEGDLRRRYRVVSVERKLPSTGSGVQS